MIEHHLLFVYQHGKHIRFSTRRMKVVRDVDIASYALEVAKNPSNGETAIRWDRRNQPGEPVSVVADSPAMDSENGTQYDICFSAGDEKRWILLELMEGVNWQFGPKSPGITRKFNASQEDHGLRFVIGGGDEARILGTLPPLDGPPPTNRSRIAYWGVAKRPANTGRGFNLHVEFYQDWKDNKGVWQTRSMPTIFDPTVPDDGNQGIPPRP